MLHEHMLTKMFQQNSRRSAKSGRPARRRRRMLERRMRSVRGRVPSPLMVKIPGRMHLLLATSKHLDLCNYRPSATSPGHRSLTNTRPLLAVSNNSKSIAAVINRCTLDTLHHLMEHQVRCIATVIKPSFDSSCRVMLMPYADSGGPAQPKQERR